MSFNIGESLRRRTDMNLFDVYRDIQAAYNNEEVTQDQVLEIVRRVCDEFFYPPRVKDPGMKFTRAEQAEQVWDIMRYYDAKTKLVEVYYEILVRPSQMVPNLTQLETAIGNLYYYMGFNNGRVKALATLEQILLLIFKGRG